MRKHLRYMAGASLFILLLLPFAYFISVYHQGRVVLGEIRVRDPNLSTRLYDINGALISEIFDQNRTFLPLKEIPLHVRNAFIATEDQNFYRHRGIDIRAVARALLVDLLRGEIRQGGSTITQQLVKQLYTKGERTLRRKITELLIAGQVEDRFTKDQILEMYLNQIYFGHGAYGISSAARFYFDRDVKDLTILQASVLAAIPSAPNRYSPLKNPEEAFERNKQVLYNMMAAGFVSKTAVREEFEKFWMVFLEETRTRYPNLGIRSRRFDLAPHFTEYVRRILMEKYGEDRVYRGGMSVYTTLDLRCQKIAEDVMRTGLEDQNELSGVHNRHLFRSFDKRLARKQLSGRKGRAGELKRLTEFSTALREDILGEAGLAALLFGLERMDECVNRYWEDYEWLRTAGRVEGVLIALDPRTGGMVSMIGGADFNARNQLNRAVQSLRQPGSAFKVFTYGAGIESEIITPASSFFDDSPVDRESGKSWYPKNYDRKFQGLVRVRKAIALSLNTVPVHIYGQVGGERIARFVTRLTGIPAGRIKVDPTLALGTTEVSPLEMARGFGVFANRGREVHPYAIRYILDRRGEKIHDEEANRVGTRIRQVISPEVAFIMTSLMRSVVDNGTAAYAVRRLSGFKLPAAGKTGTNTAFRDAWFVGFTPDLVAAVWVGCDVPRFSLGPGQSGSVCAAPLWGRFMREVYRFRKAVRFPGQPAGVVSRDICAVTGNIPVEGCPVEREYFLSGKDLTMKCSGKHEDDEKI